MKFFVALFLLQMAVAQEATRKYLVEYTVTEKCRECTNVYAIACLPATPDCGVPDIEMAHFEEFSSIKEAMTFINGGFMKTSSDHLQGGLTSWGGNYGHVGRTTFKRLLEVSEVSVEKTTDIKSEPQPPKVIESVRYHIGDEYGEARKPETIGSLTGGTSGSGSFITVGASQMVSAAIIDPAVIPDKKSKKK